jgi:hypothetical protein
VSRFRGAWFAGVIALLPAAAACGKKGPPRAPLRLVPAAVTDVSIRRLARDVHLRFTLPARNVNGPGQPEIDRVEIYAVTVEAGAPTPEAAAVIGRERLVGAVRARPAGPPGASATGKPAEAGPPPAPGPGEAATFVETLTADKMTVPAPADAVSAAPPVRVYVLQVVGPRGRRGTPARVTASLAPAPTPPTPAARVTERAIVLEWTAPADATAIAGYHVYAAGDPAAATGSPQPLNAEAITGTSWEDPGMQFGVERCYVVRSVAIVADTRIEGEPSARQCIVPVDVFPPATPANLAAVGAEGEIGLIWDRNSEPDLAGYLVLRGEAPGETLQPLTASPIREPTYRDRAVTAGVRYFYAVVAVDSAKPPNQSKPTPPVEATAK